MIKSNGARKKVFLTATISFFVISCAIGILIQRAANDAGVLSNIYLYPNSLEKNKLLVKVKALKCPEALRILGCKLCKHGIQPVAIMINNKSSAVYYFGKNEINPRCIRAQNLVPLCFNSKPWERILPVVRKKIAEMNEKKRYSYLSKEIVSDFVYPQQAKKGFLFFSQFKKTDRLIIPLVNRNTGEQITFEFLVN